MRVHFLGWDGMASEFEWPPPLAMLGRPRMASLEARERTVGGLLAVCGLHGWCLVLLEVIDDGLT
jgi:hypothetical protein